MTRNIQLFVRLITTPVPSHVIKAYSKCILLQLLGKNTNYVWAH
jgi:hypothetical protein